MYMEHKVEKDVATIWPPAHFNISAHRSFRESCKMLMEQAEVGVLIVDFRNVDYIDSSVLGSLIYIKELFEKKDGVIKIANAQGTVKEIFKIAAFNEIFEMT